METYEVRGSADKSTPDVICGAGKRHRGKHKVSDKKKKTNVPHTAGKEKGRHVDERDALMLTKTWVIVFQRSIKSEDTI